jgi:hypothetical protein
VKIRYTENKYFEIDRKNPDFLEENARPSFKILATPLHLIINRTP